MTLEEIQLMVIKKVSEIAEATPQPSGKFFYYDETGVLKKAPMTEIYNLVSNSKSLGTITSASTIPSEGNVWAFAAPGTYPNAGNLTVSPNTVGILTRVGGTWSKVEVALSSAKLPLYSAIKSADIAAGTQFIDDENRNIQYRVKTGQTLNVGELPANVVGTKVEIIGGGDTTLDIKVIDIPIEPRKITPIYHTGKRVIANGVIENKATSVYVEVDLTQIKYGVNIIDKGTGYDIYFAFYDAAGNYLLGGPSIASNAFFAKASFPVNAVKLLVTISTTNVNKTVEVIDSASGATNVWKPTPIVSVSEIAGKPISATHILGVNDAVINKLKNSEVRVTSKNLINPAFEIPNWKIEGTLGKSGYLYDPNHSIIVIKIPDNTKTYKLTPSKKNGAYSALMFLDANGNILSKIDSPSETGYIISPNPSAAYVVTNYKINTYYNPVGDLRMYEYNEIANPIDYPYDEYTEEVVWNEDEVDLEFSQVGSKNYISAEYHKTFDKSSGMFWFEIPVSGSNKVLMWREAVRYNQTTKTWQEFDEFGTLLFEEVMYMSSMTTLMWSRTTLPNTRKVRIVMIGALNETRTVQQFATTNYIGVFSAGENIIVPNVNTGRFVSKIDGVRVKDTIETDKLNGKILVTFGDSITEFGSNTSGGSWVDYIKKNTNLEVYNYGRGSAWFKNKPATDDNSTDNSISTNNTISTQIRKFLATTIVPDIAVITGGTNDSHTPALMVEGDLNTAYSLYSTPTSLDKLKIYDTIVWAVAKIRERNPNCKIYLASPIKSLNTTIKPELLKFRTAFKNTANELGCEFIDFYNSEIMDLPTSNNIYFNGGGATDFLHPSRLGVNVMGAMALQKIISTYRRYSDESITTSLYNGISNI